MQLPGSQVFKLITLCKLITDLTRNHTETATALSAARCRQVEKHAQPTEQ